MGKKSKSTRSDPIQIQQEISAIEDEAGIGRMDDDIGDDMRIPTAAALRSIGIGGLSDEDDEEEPIGNVDVLVAGGLRKAEALRKRQPKNIDVWTLYARLLMRAGDIVLCLGAVKNIYSILRKTQHLEDFRVVNPVDMICKFLQQYDLQLDFQEVRAFAKNATNRDIDSLIRTCLIRLKFSRLTSIADTLNKTLPDDPLYLLILVKATQLCTHERSSLERLAKQFVKFQKTNSLSTHGAFIYSHVLENLGRYEDALFQLSLLPDNPNVHVRLMLTKGRLTAGMGEHDSASKVFRKLLEESLVTKYPENLSCFLYYLSCLLRDDGNVICATKHDQFQPLKSIDRKSSLLISNEKFDECMATASNMLMNLKLIPTAMGNEDLIHFRRLALLEVETRKFLRGRIDREEFISTLLAYFQSFGHLACATSDILMFTDALTHEDKQVLLNRFASELKDTNDVIFLAKQMVVFKLTELSGIMLSLDVCDLQGLAMSMIELYKRCLQFLELDDTEDRKTMAGEELIALVGNVFVVLFIRSQELSYLIHAILVLEFGLSVRSSVSQNKILLVHLYSHLGAFSLASERYLSPEMEMLHVNSVCHPVLPQIVTSPCLDDKHRILCRYLSAFKHHLANSMFEFSNSLLFEDQKVIEGLEEKTRMLYSLEYVMAKLDCRILSLQMQNTIEGIKLYLQNSLGDGRFLENLRNHQHMWFSEVESNPWWSRTPLFNYLLESSGHFSANNPIFRDGDMQVVQRESDKRVLHLIDRKFALLQLISLSVETASSSLRRSNDTSKFHNLLEVYANSLGFSVDTAEVVIFEISDGIKSFQQDVVPGEDVNDLITCAVFLNAFKFISSVEVATTYWELPSKLIKIYTTDFVEYIRQVSWCPGPYISRYTGMVMEPLAWHTLIMTLAIDWIKMGHEERHESKIKLLSTVILQSIESLCDTLEELIHAIEEYKLKVDYSETPCKSGKVCSVLGDLASSLGKAKHISGDGLSNALMLSFESIESDVRVDLLSTLSNFKTISEEKLKLLISLKSKMTKDASI